MKPENLNKLKDYPMKSKTAPYPLTIPQKQTDGLQSPTPLLYPVMAS